MKEGLELRLNTDLSAEELTRKLSKYVPWGHRIDFSNGVSTKDLEQRVPFSEHTTNKIQTVAKHIPFETFRGGAVLDIGCNSGHNSIYVASQFGMRPTGIDVARRHIEVSNLLSDVANIEADYLLENAETFRRDNAFDVVLHFGTLYHLPNPLMSLESTYKNLRKGGYLALETQVYDHPKDGDICYYMNMHNNDITNFWALSTQVLKRYMTLLGFVEIQEILRVKPKMLGKYMSRIILVAQK